MNNYEFVDCGAYDGDTIRDFFRALNRQNGVDYYRRIYALEPNEYSYLQLHKNFGKESKITLLKKGAWSSSETLRFSGNKLRSSFVDENGTDRIEVAPLDELLPEAEPTFIKFDIEGAEQEALKGARRLIKNNHPRLAVCVYHQNNDLVTIPYIIDQLHAGYNMYLRAYESKSGEVVLYCIP